jgi:hypothetical protein
MTFGFIDVTTAICALSHPWVSLCAWIIQENLGWHTAHSAENVSQQAFLLQSHFFFHQ